MSNTFTSESPIARKDAWRLALVTLRTILVAASQSVVEERSRPFRRDSASKCRPNEEDDCNVVEDHSSSGTTATPRTSSLVQNGSSDNDSDGSSAQVRQWHSVGGRVMNALRDEILCEDDKDEVTVGTTATPSSGPASAPCDPSDAVDESDDATVSVGQWHAVGGRLMNALRDETLCEDEGEGGWKKLCAVNDRIASAFRRSQEDSESELEEPAWKSVGNRLASVFGENKVSGNSESSVGALLLLGLADGIEGLDLREWYAVGTRLAVSCHNYARWADGKVDHAAWQLLCTTAFSGRVKGIPMRRELDSLCRGYTTMCRSFAALGKGGFATPDSKEVDVAETVAWQQTGSRLAAVCRNITDSGSDELAFAALREVRA